MASYQIPQDKDTESIRALNKCIYELQVKCDSPIAFAAVIHARGITRANNDGIIRPGVEGRTRAVYC